jgi:hypothetical protein
MTARFTCAPGLDSQTFSFKHDIEPLVDIGVWLLGVLAHYPYPDQIVRFARRWWPLVDDPPCVLRVFGNAEPAETTAPRAAKA